MYLLHHINIVATLRALKREAYVFKISDRILLPVHIVWLISRNRRAYLRIINALARIASAKRIHVAASSEKIGSLFDAEGMNGYIIGAHRNDLINCCREGFEFIPGQARNKVGIDIFYAGISCNIISAEKIRSGMLSADTAKNVIVQGLRIYANSRDPVLCGNRHFFLVYRIGSSRFKSKLLKRSNVIVLVYFGEQEAKLICCEDRGRSAAYVDSFYVKAKLFYT